MTDRSYPDARPQPSTPMSLVLMIGKNRLEITAGPSDVVLDIVRMWLEAIGGTDDDPAAAQARINVLGGRFETQIQKVEAAMDLPTDSTTSPPVVQSP